MNSYTYSQARQQLAKVLDEAARDGGVQITRRDGSAFILRPVRTQGSPLDVASVRLDRTISREEIVEAVREARERP